MDPLTFVLLAFATYRVTRFTQLDSMFEDTRDVAIQHLVTRRKAAATSGTRLVKLRSTFYRKVVDGATCAFCVSFWVAVGWLAFLAAVTDYEFDWMFVLHAFAVAGAAMMVYRIIDPPTAAQ